jgi:hypothetical protein
MVDLPEPDITFYDDIEGYCSALSYRPGDTAGLHVSTKGDRFDVTVERWGAGRRQMWSANGLEGRFSAPPTNADSHGCRWPVTAEVPVGTDWDSGFYLVTLRAHGAEPGRDVAHTGFVVRTADEPQARSGRALLVLATNTWNAYNTWGGASLYTGGTHVAFARPWSRGMLMREPTERDDRKARPTRWGEEPDSDGELFQRYRLSRGYAASIGSSGWYTYERRFVEWAEAGGYRFDYAVSSDLDHDPGIADGYDLLVGVGHDEYWSGPQRDAVEDHVRRGGRYVSLSGNTMFWQVRIEPVGGEAVGAGPVDGTDRHTMVCHKYTAHETDPVMASVTNDGTGRPEDVGLMTGMWADPLVGRPEAEFLGGGSAWGLYNRFGKAVRRGAGAFTVYRPEHWLLAGTDLGYGDLLGAKHGAVGYETLGCRIQFDEFQQPVRAGGDGTPEHMEIVAFSPSSNTGVGEYPKSISALSDQGDLEFIAQRIHGDLSTQSLAKARYGTAIVADVHPFGPDGGEVITVGTTDWVFGLPDDPGVVQVTRNALEGRRA